jgi:flagellin
MANISTALGQVAAGINALKGHQSNMHSLAANARAAASRIQDTDFARESANLAQSSILNQSALAMVAQANNAMANILTLLN